MNLVVQISGDRKSVGEFLSFLKTDEKYFFYTSANYLFSPSRNAVELTYQRSVCKEEKDGERETLSRL
ncbi:hypothetical protein MK805_00915 [Shimazuella sp. AN120528]|uniref:hypothetical protein n=1 Tax=Shimazuella soli TaxID=1892854 RepID=UPI001F0EE672|nr:hypothetical protein [Shimazuella soli]MCH5583532.1 hypothetical protein [Shimazuella soli]